MRKLISRFILGKEKKNGFYGINLLKILDRLRGIGPANTTQVWRDPDNINDDDSIHETYDITLNAELNKCLEIHKPMFDYFHDKESIIGANKKTFYNYMRFILSVNGISKQLRKKYHDFYIEHLNEHGQNLHSTKFPVFNLMRHECMLNSDDYILSQLYCIPIHIMFDKIEKFNLRAVTNGRIDNLDIKKIYTVDPRLKYLIMWSLDYSYAQPKTIIDIILKSLNLNVENSKCIDKYDINNIKTKSENNMYMYHNGATYIHELDFPNEAVNSFMGVSLIHSEIDFDTAGFAYDKIHELYFKQILPMVIQPYVFNFIPKTGVRTLKNIYTMFKSYLREDVIIYKVLSVFMNVHHEVIVSGYNDNSTFKDEMKYFTSTNVPVEIRKLIITDDYIYRKLYDLGEPIPSYTIPTMFIPIHLINMNNITYSDGTVGNIEYWFTSYLHITSGDGSSASSTYTRIFKL